MSTAPMEDDVRTLWQAQRMEGRSMGLDDIRRRAERYERRIARRNMREYAAGATVLVALGVWMWNASAIRGLNPTVLRLACSLLIAGVVYSMFQLHKRGAGQVLPVATSLAPSLTFHRQSLMRQRDLLDSVWSWGLLPLVPGLLALMVTVGTSTGGRRDSSMLTLVPIAVTAGVFALLAWKNKQAARRLQGEIDGLDDLGK